MKKFYQFGIAMLLIGFSTVGAIAQINCTDTVVVNLHVFTGTAVLHPGSIVKGEIPEGTVLSRTEVTCEDVGDPIEITATAGDGSSCWSLVYVVDQTPPVAIADADVYFVIPPDSSSFTLTPDLIDDGTYDQCSDVTLSIEPSVINCSDSGKSINVVLTAIDAYGNMSSVISTVHVSGGSVQPLECREDFEISIVTQTQITEEIIRNDIDCSETTFILTDENGIEIADGIIDISYIGQTVSASITQVESNSTCTTQITVIDLDCAPFEICDTACNSTAIGDCSSGHSDTDNGEWPCDVTIADSFVSLEASSPDKLISDYGVVAKDSKPVIVEEACHVVSMSYLDQVFYLADGGVKILREWTILEWNTMYAVSYTQTLVFSGGGPALNWNICDTQANDAPIGDCDSGHTDLDDVEWPADITVNDHRVSPEELEKVSDIPLGNVQPELVNNEEFYVVSYVDQVLSSAPEVALVGRVWTLKSTQSVDLSAQYIQRILIPAIDNAANKVFVTTQGGRPMPGVSVNSGVTDEEGVIVVEGDGEIEVTYEDDPALGIDILDEVLLTKIILAQIPFTDFPYTAMDINEDGRVTTLDIVNLRKLYLGVYDPLGDEWGWRFLQRNDPFISVKGDIVAYKKGDLDDSVPLSGASSPEPESSLILEDMLLNEGESYTVDLRIDHSFDIYAGQFFYNLDLSSIEIEDLVSSMDQADLRWQIDEAGLLSAFLIDSDPNAVNEDSDLLRISFKALKNTTLNRVLTLSDENETFLVDANLEKLYLDEEVRGEITSGVLDFAYIKDIGISPNPARDLITVRGDFTSALQIDIFDTSGNKIGSSTKTEINISEFPSGIYLLQGNDDETLFKARFVKL